MTYREILESYTFSRRFLVQYACSCAREVAHLSSDPRVMRAITTAEAWIEGKATEQACRDAAYTATYPAIATNADYSAANAAYTASATYASAYTFAFAAAIHAIDCNVKGKDEEYFTKLLLTMIQTHLSSFEREMMGL